MNQPTFPDALQVAGDEAQKIQSSRHEYLVSPLERLLADSPHVEPASLTQGLEAFHAQRMAAIPSPAKYPEARPWVEHVLAVDRELQRLANLTDREMALYRSLGVFGQFRGFKQARPRMGLHEKCRVVYLPDSDEGQVHIKNIDDPSIHWKPKPPPTEWHRTQDLQIDGVGSGLHIDDEPEEIFPLPALAMVHHYANEVPGDVEFLTRYGRFWSGANVVVYDRQKRSVAIEKCGRKFIDVFAADGQGASHVSGMVCRNPDSPQGRHQRAKREQYRTLFGLKADGPDQTFWNLCELAEAKLAAGVDALAPRASVEKLFTLFTTPWPHGLNKTGAKFHPDQGYPEYTLFTTASLLDKRRYYRWQRSLTLEYPEKPEVYQF